jgi:hypothetical protein
MTIKIGSLSGIEIGGGPIEPAAGKFDSRTILVTDKGESVTDRTKKIPITVSMHQSFDPTNKLRAHTTTYANGLAAATHELKFGEIDAKIYAEGYAFVSEKYGNKATEIYKNAYLSIADDQSGTVANTRAYALNSAGGYACAVKNNIPNAERYATIYADYIDHGGSIEYARVYGLIWTESEFEEHDSDLYGELHGRNCQELVDTFNDSNIAKNYLEYYRKDVKLHVKEPISTANYDMHRIAASKAMAHTRASIGFYDQSVDPSEYTEMYSEVYVAKFNEFVEKGASSDRAHSLAEGYAYAFVELGCDEKQDITEADSIAEGYARARKCGFSDEQARAFPFVQRAYLDIFGEFNLSEKCQTFIKKDLANVYVEAKKRAAISHKIPVKMYKYAWTIIAKCADEGAERLRKALETATNADDGTILEVYDNGRLSVRREIEAQTEQKLLKDNANGWKMAPSIRFPSKLSEVHANN